MKRITLLLLFVCTIASAQWSTPPQPIATGVGDQYPGATLTRNHSVIDAAGNVITIFWNSAGNYQYIYAQKTNSQGYTLWDTGGKLLYTGAYTYTRGNTVYNAVTQNADTQIVSDGAGGAIISFTGTDYNYEYSPSFTPNVLNAIRIDADGNQVWSSRCVVNRISAANGTTEEHTILPDGNGGAYFGWVSRVYTAVGANSNLKVFFQHINADGSRQFAEDVFVKDLNFIGSYGSGFTIYPTVALLSSGEVLIAWNDLSSGSWTLFANKINQEGSLQWAPAGVVVDHDMYTLGTDLSGYSAPVCATVNGGVYLCYRTTSLHTICMLHNDGSFAFSPMPLSEAQGSNTQYYDMVATPEGEAIAFYDFNGNPTVQKINSTGTRLFGSNGINIGTDDCSVNYGVLNKRIVKTAQNKYLAAYTASQNSVYRMKANMFDADGNFSFSPGGISLSYNQGGANLNLLATNDGGGVLVFSAVNGNLGRDTYASKIYPENNPVKITLHNGNNTNNVVTMETTDNINYFLDNYSVGSDNGLFFRKDESVLINNAVRAGLVVSNTVCGTPYGTTGIAPATYYVTFNRITKAYEFIDILSAEHPRNTTAGFYPNPADDVLYCTEMLTQVTLYTVEGKKVLQQNNVSQLSVSHLPAGMYFATGTTAAGTVSYRFIKK